jgi:hypothetical protein
MVGFKERENERSDSRGVTADLVREGVKGVPIIVHCCPDRKRGEEDGILLLKLGIYNGSPDTYPVIICPEKPSSEVTAEVIALRHKLFPFTIPKGCNVGCTACLYPKVTMKMTLAVIGK